VAPGSQIGVKGRVARGLTERLNSIHATLRMPIPDQMRREYESRLARISDAADKTKDFAAVRSKNGRLDAIDERIPTATELATLVLGGSGGELAYRDLSAASHGTLYALVGRMEVFDDPLGKHDKIGQPRLRMETLVPMVGMAVLAFENAVDREFELYGWPRDEWELWRIDWAQTLLPLARK
jgi:hypothetical protein